MEKTEGGITAPQGFSAAGVVANIRKKGRRDIALVFSEVECTAAAVYTKNKFRAAPLTVTADNLADGRAQALAVNSGIANACMGGQGLADAENMAVAAAEALGLEKSSVIVASTGLIGAPLPMERIRGGIAEAAAGLSRQGGHDAALAIMTTDTVEKELAFETELGGKKIVFGSMAKGSGMIHPDMATMLGFVTTDAAVSAQALQQALSDAVQDTFNMISVDGDTSTNDMVAVMANGKAGNEEITLDSGDYPAFREALFTICRETAIKIASDGEGATKLFEVRVKGAPAKDDARKAARAVSSSNLMKTAIFGEDANWGRAVTAAGYSGAEFDPMKTDVWIGDLKMAENGGGLVFDEDRAKEILEEKHIVLTIDFKSGSCSATAWSCDFSYDYVKINAGYRS